MTFSQAVIRGGALAVGVAAVFWFSASHRPLHHAPGILVGRDPEQISFADPPPPIERHGWTLHPLARYSIVGRVLGKQRYAGDAIAALAPYDLALGWGRMSDEAVLERLDISQSDRYYRWQYWGQPPLPVPDIITHSSNNHVIPADEATAKRIASLRVGSLVEINGLLVEATHPQANRPWRSSLTRDDSGEGACELILVESLAEITPGR